MDLDDLPDDATEIVEARLRRVDLVKSPASGMPFFIAKSLDPEQPVTDVTKSDAEDLLDSAVSAPKLGDERPSDHPGDPDDPQSAAWEAVDAAGGRAAVNALMSLKSIVAGLLSRESVESFTGSDEDADENAYDLDSVLCALDFALGVLAPFAVTEQAEADDRAEDALIKSAAALVAVTATVDAGIAKAGRVLSSANEAAIRGAVESLTKVLDSLPAAKEADVSKADENVEPVTEAVPEVEVAKGEEEGVAKADDLTALSDDDLRRLAITGEDGQRQAALAEIGMRVLTSGDAVPDAKPEDAADEESADPADVDPNSDPDAPVAAEDMTKSTPEPDEAPADVAKALADQKTEFDSVVKALTDRIYALEESPAPVGVLHNGVTPPSHLLRGQDADAPLGARADVRKAFSEEQDPEKQKRIADAMHASAYEAVINMHTRS